MFCPICRRVVHGKGRHHKAKFHRGMKPIKVHKKRERYLSLNFMEREVKKRESVWKKVWRMISEPLRRTSLY